LDGTPMERYGLRAARIFAPPSDREAEIRCYMRDTDGHLTKVSQLVGRTGDQPPNFLIVKAGKLVQAPSNNYPRK
jgi:hypothetical protein